MPDIRHVIHYKGTEIYKVGAFYKVFYMEREATKKDFFSAEDAIWWVDNGGEYFTTDRNFYDYEDKDDYWGV